jgi:hypothetical protein
MMLITIEKPINEKTDVLQLLTNARKITKVLTILKCQTTYYIQLNEFYEAFWKKDQGLDFQPVLINHMAAVFYDDIYNIVFAT